MEDVAVTVDVNHFDDAMREVGNDFGVAASEIARDNMALICADLMRSTPPIDVGDGYRGSDASAYRLGKAAVERDIKAIIYGVEDWKTQYVRESAGRHIMRDTDGAIYVVEDAYLDPDGSKLAAYHDARRLPATGRVGQGAKTGANALYKIANYTAQRKMQTPKRVLDAYVKKKQDDIGKTRAGWLAALLHFSANALTSRYNAPGWVTKHGTASGSFEDAGDAAGLSGIWTATNSVPWIRRTAVAKMMDSVLRTRARDFFGGNYRMRLQRALDAHKPKG